MNNLNYEELISKFKLELDELKTLMHICNEFEELAGCEGENCKHYKGSNINCSLSKIVIIAFSIIAVSRIRTLI